MSKRTAPINMRCRSCGVDAIKTGRKWICPKADDPERAHLAHGVSWSAVAYTNPPGAPRRRKRAYFARYEDAEAWVNEISYKVSRHQVVDISKMQLGSFLEDIWLPQVERRVRANTLDTYRWEISYAEPLYQRPLGSITFTDLDALYRDLEDRGLSPRTVRGVHGRLSQAFSYAIRKQMLHTNPADYADPPKAKAARKSNAEVFWTPEESKAFLGARLEAGDRLWTLWWLLIATGMRRSEALGLFWDDVHIKRGDPDPHFEIRRTRVTTSSQGVYDEEMTKSASSRRRISLYPEEALVLRDWRKLQSEERMARRLTYSDSAYVFTKTTGGPYNPDWITKRFGALVAEQDLPALSPHGLRHTCASYLIGADVPMKVVQERLGHASIQITMDLYSHLLPGADRRAAEVSASLFPARLIVSLTVILPPDLPPEVQTFEVGRGLPGA